MKKSLRVSILSHKEEQFLKQQLVGLKTQQLKALSENKILNEFLLTVSIEKKVLAYSSNNNEIYWDASNGFVLNLSDNFYENFDEVCSALQACREVFFEDYLTDEDLTDLKGMSLVSEFTSEESTELTSSPEPHLDSPKEITPEAPIEEEEAVENSENSEAEETIQDSEVEVEESNLEIDDSSDEVDLDSALELADQLISDAQEEDLTKSEEISSDEDVEDALKLADQMISEVESIESSEDEPEEDATSNPEPTLPEDIDHAEDLLPEPITQEEAPQEEDEIDVTSLLDRVGELDKSTLSGGSDDIEADEFANLTHTEDEHASEEAPQEEEEVDLLSRIGEIDSNTLTDSHDDIPADEFTNLAAVEEEAVEDAAVEPQAEEAVTEEIAQPVPEEPIAEVKKELSPQEIAEQAQRDLEAITEEMYAIGMDDDKIETLINAVQDGKATIDVIRQTIDKVKNS